MNQTERTIVAGLLETLFAAGYEPSHTNGVRTLTPKAVMQEADEDTMVVHFTCHHNEFRPWVLLIPGNDEEIISDYSWREGEPFGQTIDEYMDQLTTD